MKINRLLVLLIFMVFAVSAQISQLKSLLSQGAGLNLTTLGTISPASAAAVPIDLSSVSGDNGKKQTSPSNLTGFDGTIDENEYIIGTGDRLSVYFWKNMGNQFSSEVDFEGNFLIPSIGFVNIKGLVLKEARRVIAEYIKSHYKDPEFSIVLTKIRKFKIYVLGRVVVPGYYIVTGATRVSDAIDFAGGFVNDENSSFNYHRTIRVTNNNFPAEKIDLALFYNTGDCSGNPYLREGDRIVVNAPNKYISVTGAVNYPASYGYIAGDSLKSVIKSAGGFSRGADSSDIVVTRFADNIDSLVEFHLSLENGKDGSFKIMPDDRIMVKRIPDYRIHRNVTIKGEVMYPGVYPIQEDKTKLTDIIKLAGGLTENAFLEASKIVRKNTLNSEDMEFKRLQATPIVSMTPIERSYLKTKLTEEDGMVSINFKKLISNGLKPYDMILKAGDEITIQRKVLSVKVSGSVVSPGLVNYEKGKSYTYYINKAGGLNTKAKKKDITIIKAGYHTRLKPRKVKTIDAGDIIWVPEKPYKDRLIITKEVLYIIGSIATTVLSGFAIKSAIEGK